MNRNQLPKGDSYSKPSGLTMKLTGANLPVVPQFVPEPLKEDVKPDPIACGVAASASAITEHSSSVLQPSSGQPESNLSAARTLPRPRYVLPPDHATLPSSNDVDPSLVLTGRTSGTTSCLPQNPSDFAVTENNTVQAVSEHTLPNTNVCEPVTPFWFFATNVNGTRIWWPFSRYDSQNLEAAASKSNLTSICGLLANASSSADSDTVVQVEGGRYDVFLRQRIRRSVYWTEPDAEVRRATWFYRAPNENRVLPFSEMICEQLEAQYTATVERNLWENQFELPTEDPRGGSDRYIFNNPQSMIQYRMWAPDSAIDPTQLPQSLPGDAFMKLAETGVINERDSRLFYLRRGLDEQLLSQLDDGDSRPVDHVYFVVHGIGTIYNLKGHGLVECVNALRRTSQQIAQRHFPDRTGRAEFLPIMWHDALHSDATGVDEQLTKITLHSIPKLRQFTNGTLMDILFYTSSKYCQVVLDSVAGDLRKLRSLFLTRNPDFTGGFSIIGHSLGSVVAFDLLAHQNSHGRPSSNLPAVLGTSEELLPDPDVPTPHNGILPFTGFGTPTVTYPQLDFPVTAIFLLGSPLGLFLTARGIHKLSPDYCLPTCSAFYNIFHPFDPVAYRMESLIDPTFDLPAALMPHHKGRKRLHLQFRDELARVGSDIKSILFQSAQATWRSIQDFAFSHRFLSSQDNMDRADGDHFQEKVNELTELCSDCNTESDDVDEGKMSEPDDRTRFTSRLNRGRRLDFILQEAPLERFSDYLFALSSHATYWESEDTSLFLLTEIYSGELDSSNSLPKHVNTVSLSHEQGTARMANSSSLTGNPPVRTTTTGRETLESTAWPQSKEYSTHSPLDMPYATASPLHSNANSQARKPQDQSFSSMSEHQHSTAYSSRSADMSVANPMMIPSDPNHQSKISDFVS